MSQRELFEARVHAVMCALASNPEPPAPAAQFVGMAVELVNALDRRLQLEADAKPMRYGQTFATAGADLRAGDLVTVFPAEPMAWRPMSEIAEAVDDIVVVFRNGRRINSGVFSAEEYEHQGMEDTDLGWLQLPPLPTEKL